ncbi:MAG: hypothetical protein WA416_06230 [Candidatus Sulfotelmatobacter sp.]
MTLRKSILLLLSLGTIAALLACGSSSHKKTTTPPPGPPLPDGTYVFSLSGTDTNDYSPYYVSGAFTVASGAITGGEQDFTDFVSSDLFDQINPTGSSLATTADGNLQITLVTCAGAVCTSTDDNIGPSGNGTETINGTLLPLSTTSRTFINEFDAWASGSGELDTQSSVAALSGGYAFVLGGWDFNGDPLSVGGILNVSAGSILPAGSTFDLNDPSKPTLVEGGAFTGASSVTAAPDTFGRVTFSIDPTNATGINSLVVVGYTVDGNRITLLEGFGDNLGGTEGGVALSQSNGTVTTGTFTAANAAGTYVIGLNGYDTGFDVLQIVNQLTLTGTAVTGFVDFNDLVSSSVSISPDPITAATYTVDAAGAGDVTIAGITDGSGVHYNLHLYLDGNGHALAISTDATDALAGVGFTQGAGPYAFSGAYGVDVTGWDFNYFGEFDGVGPVTAAASGGTFSGDLDVNWLNLQTAPLEVTNNSLTGTFVTTGTGASNGIFAGGSITGIDMTTCPAFTSGGTCTADAFSYYLIDAAGDNIFIETDLFQATLGVAAQQ